MSATKTKKLNDPSIPRVTEVPDSAVMLVCDAQGRLTPISVKNLRQMLNATFVDKAGDTMTGALTISPSPNTSNKALALKHHNIDAHGVFMLCALTNVDKSAFGWNINAGTYLFSYASNKYLNIKDDGTPCFDGHILWHAGNDGAGSGLDADLLDGKHADDFVGKTDFDVLAARVAALENRGG